jgi:hypothetical protein
MKPIFSMPVLLAALVAICACHHAPDQDAEVPIPPGPPNVFPARAASILRSADTIQALSLEYSELSMRPGFSEEEGFNWFHGQKILDTANVADTDRKAFADAVIAAIAPTQTPAPCFFPHHGVHAVSKSGSVDLVICLMCDWVKVYYSDGEGDGFSPSAKIVKPLVAVLPQKPAER